MEPLEQRVLRAVLLPAAEAQRLGAIFGGAKGGGSEEGVGGKGDDGGVLSGTQHGGGARPG